jgi:hypothetical protein
MNTFPGEVQAFVDAVEAAGTGFSEADMEANARGAHFFSIMGHDRQCKAVHILCFLKYYTSCSPQKIETRSL